MRVRILGDFALLIDGLEVDAATVAASLDQRLRELGVEAVPSYDAVGVYFRSGPLRADLVESALSEMLTHPEQAPTKKHIVPACYDLGPDLKSTATSLGISADDLAQIHSSNSYKVYAVGFCPGFPYLGYLPDEISGTPRLPKPRLRVEPGMIGITGRQTGIYPSSVPGGWNLIARTPLSIVDVEEGYFPISVGDEVVFERIDEQQYSRLVGECL